MSEVKEISKHLGLFLRCVYLRYNDAFCFIKLALFNLLFTFLHFPALVTRFISFCGLPDDYICVTRIKNSPTCVPVKENVHKKEVKPNQLFINYVPQIKLGLVRFSVCFSYAPKNYKHFLPEFSTNFNPLHLNFIFSWSSYEGNSPQLKIRGCLCLQSSLLEVCSFSGLELPFCLLVEDYNYMHPAIEFKNFPSLPFSSLKDNWVSIAFYIFCQIQIPYAYHAVFYLLFSYPFSSVE